MLKNEYSQPLAREKAPRLERRGLLENGILPKFMNSIPFLPLPVKLETLYFAAFWDLIKTITFERDGQKWHTENAPGKLAG